MKLAGGLTFCTLILGISLTSWAQSSATAPVEHAHFAGYTDQSANLEREWEKKFQEGVARENLRENMRRLSARPHNVGSPYDKENAEWMLSKFREWGFDAHIETFKVLFPTPNERLLELVAPNSFRAKLKEPIIVVNPTTNQSSEQLPTYNAYSIDGDVTAPLIYVNYGDRDDYDQLDRLGVSVKGSIVIARYGEAWRGTKPKVAAERGAIGCIIYSDGFHTHVFCIPTPTSASTPFILGKSRMRKRARTDLCGGWPAMVVPTATTMLAFGGPNLKIETLPSGR